MGDLDLDELADARSGGTPRRNQHFLLDLRIIRLDKADTGLLEVAPDDGFMGAGQHFDNRAFATTTPVQPRNARQGAVTVKHQTHLGRTEEQVIAAIIRDQKAKAITMATDAPTDQIQLVDRRVGAAPGINQLSIALHGAQAAAQGLQLLFGGQPELVYQLFTAGRGATLIKPRQNQFATGDGVLVFFRLAGGLGIEGLPIGH